MNGLDPRAGIAAQLLREGAAAERFAARIRLGLFAALLSIELVRDAFQASALPGTAPVLAIGVVALAYAGAVEVVLRRSYRPAISYVTTACDVALLTTLLVAIGAALGQWDSPWARQTSVPELIAQVPVIGPVVSLTYYILGGR